MRKIQKTSKLDGAIGRVQFGSLRNCLNPIVYKLDMHVDVLLPINNYIASILLYPLCMKLAKNVVKLVFRNLLKHFHFTILGRPLAKHFNPDFPASLSTLVMSLQATITC